MSSTRRVRSRDRFERSPRRQRRIDSPENSGVSHYHYYQGDINVEQPPWMAGTTRIYRGCARIRKTPGGGDGSSPGDEDDSLPGGGNPGRGQPPVRKNLKPLREEQEDHQMEIQEVMDPQVVEDIHPDKVHLEEEDPRTTRRRTTWSPWTPRKSRTPGSTWTMRTQRTSRTTGTPRTCRTTRASGTDN